MTLRPYCCTHCGFWQRRSALPTACPVCEDFRHPLPPRGYDFADAARIDREYRSDLREVLPRLWQVRTTPQLGIGSCGLLLVTDAGNLHFEGAGWYSDAALERIAELGGVRWQAFSHAHVLGAGWRVDEHFSPRAVVQDRQLPWAQALNVTLAFDAV